jgi:protein involved in polysaccharide export with SLBB domain
MKPANLLKYIVLLCFCLAFVVARAVPGLAQGAPGVPLGVATDESYKLGTGDKVKITVFGQDDLGGEFLVDDTGYLRLPLIGQVKAAGLTVHQFEDAVIAKLADGYLKDPRVSVEVTNYRPFYIIGEVNKPGEYPYVNGMNVLNAVALAGGYTYRADDTVVYVRRKGEQTEEKDPADQTTEIHPGDIVRIAERFF